MDLTRRDLLLASGAVVLAGCGASKPSAAPEPSASGSVPASASAAPDLASLGRSVPLLQPADQGYDAGRLLFNRRFDALKPDAVARPRTEADVATCVAYARDTGTPLRVRSGGHSYVGDSAGPGLVVDLRDLASITVDKAGQRATVGAGASLVDVYAQLGAQGVSIPAGSCAAVGLSGLTLGGGMGVVGRLYGLTCDRLRSARVVLADGRTVDAGADSEPDLFFALRGGGGSFGLVTALTYETHDTGNVAPFFLRWPWAQADAVLSAWQQWAPVQDDRLWSTCAVLATMPADNLGPQITVSGVYVGPSSALQVPLDALAAAVGSAPGTRSVQDLDYLATMLQEASCAGVPLAECRIADYGGTGKQPRDAFVASSDFFSRAIPPDGVRAVVDAVQRRQDTGLGVGGTAFDVWGGAVNRVAAGDTAFVHRDAQFAVQYSASWGLAPDNGPQAANEASLADLVAALRPSATGGQYQNYGDTTLAMPQQAYWGANLPRLQSIKRAYDPHNLFAPSQGVTPVAP